jgi:hypothetical protein
LSKENLTLSVTRFALLLFVTTKDDYLLCRLSLLVGSATARKFQASLNLLEMTSQFFTTILNFEAWQRQIDNKSHF